MREALLWKLEGLSEYDIRRPLTPTGTNLLGLVKHLSIVEARYFGETFGTRQMSTTDQILLQADLLVETCRVWRGAKLRGGPTRESSRGRTAQGCASRSVRRRCHGRWGWSRSP